MPEYDWNPAKDEWLRQNRSSHSTMWCIIWSMAGFWLKNCIRINYGIPANGCTSYASAITHTKFHFTVPESLIFS